MKVGIGPGSICTTRVVSGIGGDMVKDYEEYRKYGFMRYPLLKVRGIEE